MDEASEPGSASGYSGTAPPPPKADGGEAPKSESPSNDPPKKTEPDVDNFGYEKPKKEEEPPKKKEEDPPPKDPPKEEPPKPASGYDKEPPKVEDPSKADDDKDKKTDDKEKVEFKVDDPEKLLLPEEISNLENLVKKHNIDHDLAKILVENKKQEIKEYTDQIESNKEQAKLAKARKHREWWDELQADPNFGGEKFANNVARVDKVIGEFFPTLKKQLTDQGEKLPPGYMKDLLKLGNHLYNTEKLVNGEPPAKKEEDSKDKEKSDSPLDFYSH